jgi:hypothetical protein
MHAALVKFLVPSIVMVSALPLIANPKLNCDAPNRVKRSCWLAQNDADKAVEITCSEKRYRTEFKVAHLKSQKSYSEQYDLGWGDGLGFPEPGLEYSCKVELGAKTVKFKFTTIDWGDSLRFWVSNKAVTLEQRYSWQGSKTQRREFPF